MKDIDLKNQNVVLKNLTLDKKLTFSKFRPQKSKIVTLIVKFLTKKTDFFAVLTPQMKVIDLITKLYT